jgi:serine/threonine protein kinase
MSRVDATGNAVLNFLDMKKRSYECRQRHRTHHNVYISTGNDGQPVVVKTAWRKNEVILLRQLSHPNIIQLVDSFDNVCVMPLYRMDLLVMSRIARPIPSAALVSIAYDIIQGLVYLHNKEMAHGDLTPSNILWDGDHALLSDFGASGNSNQFATLWYTSPEKLLGQVMNTHDKRCANDMWAYGCILAELVVGRAPFRTEYEEEEDPGELAQLLAIYGVLGTPPVEQQHATLQFDAIDPVPVERIVVGLPSELLRLVESCWLYNTAERMTASQGCTYLEHLSRHVTAAWKHKVNHLSTDTWETLPHPHFIQPKRTNHAKTPLSSFA